MGFTRSLKTEWKEINGKLRWVALESFEFHSGAKDEGLFVRCEAGMVSDLASIPRIVRWLIPKAGKDAQGAFIHDRVYRDGFMIMRIEHLEKRVRVSRAMADGLYHQSMLALKVGKWRRRAIYRGLRAGGFVAWNKYRKANTGMQTETTR